MVMKPEPWGEALDELLPDGATLVVPTPSGSRSPRRSPGSWPRATTWSSRAAATRASTSGCSTTRATRAEVREISIGDYVLNGGEVAALVDHRGRRAAAPGLHGQPRVARRGVPRGRAAGVPRLHQARDLARARRPEVLLSGDHAAIAAWRHEQARAPYGRAPARTSRIRARRARSTRADGLVAPDRRGRALLLQRACWVQECTPTPASDPGAARDARRPAARWLEEDTSSCSGSGGRLVGAVRGRLLADGTPGTVGRLMVAPDLRGRGSAASCWSTIEAAAPPTVTTYSLFTGRAASATSGCTSGPDTGSAARSSPGVVRFDQAPR